MIREGTFQTRRIDLAACLFLKKAVAADVVGMGMSIVYGGQVPIVGCQNLQDLLCGILVVPLSINTTSESEMRTTPIFAGQSI